LEFNRNRCTSQKHGEDGKSWRDWEALDAARQQYMLYAVALYRHVHVLDHIEAPAPQGCCQRRQAQQYAGRAQVLPVWRPQDVGHGQGCWALLYA